MRPHTPRARIDARHASALRGHDARETCGLYTGEHYYSPLDCNSTGRLVFCEPCSLAIDEGQVRK